MMDDRGKSITVQDVEALYDVGGCEGVFGRSLGVSAFQLKLALICTKNSLAGESDAQA
jgi:hypothetical protein